MCYLMFLADLRVPLGVLQIFIKNGILTSKNLDMGQWGPYDNYGFIWFYNIL